MDRNTHNPPGHTGAERYWGVWEEAWRQEPLYEKNVLEGVDIGKMVKGCGSKINKMCLLGLGSVQQNLDQSQQRRPYADIFLCTR